MDRTEITRALAGAATGDVADEAHVWTLVYEELHRVAHRQLGREHGERTLCTTALIHEAYFKLVDDAGVARRDRAHFYALACRAMRQVLVDHARARNAAKREGGWRRVTLGDDVGATASRLDELLALDEALTRLAAFSHRLGRVVELRFYGGLTAEETADILDVDVRTVERDWQRARAYLKRLLTVQDA